MKKTGRMSSLLGPPLALLVFGSGTATAGWSKPGKGIVHVPIAPIQTRTQLSPQLSIADHNVTGPIPPAELAVLRMHPPFQGKSDAEILAKMNAIRENVRSAIEALREDGNAENMKLVYCLRRAFHSRRLCIEFSERKIAGVTNANRFPPHSANSDSEKDACALAGIAVKDVPCTPLPSWSGEILALGATLFHEALHLTQTWPPSEMPKRIQWNAPDIINRIRFQQNEIAASEAEKQRLENLFQVFQWISIHGEIPEDTRNFKKLPVSIEQAGKFMKATPEAQRMTKADEIADVLADRVIIVCHTLKCRQAVKAALDQLLVNFNLPGIDRRVATRAYRKAINGSSASSGWIKTLRGRTYNGLFSVNLIAGGLGDDTNVICQFLNCVSNKVSIPEDYLTDVWYVDDSTLWAVGSTDGSGMGSIYQFRDSDGDGWIEPDTLTLKLRHEYLYGSNSFAATAGGQLYLLNRTSLMFFRLDEDGGGNPMPVYQGTIGDPDLDDINHVLIGDDELSVTGVPFADTALTANLGWVQSTRGSAALPFTTVNDFSWLEDAQFAPGIITWPYEFDEKVDVSGTPNGAFELGTITHGIPQVLDSGSFDAGGFASHTLSAPLTAGKEIWIQEPGGGNRQFPMQVCADGPLTATIILPTMSFRDLVRSSTFPFAVRSRPNVIVEAEMSLYQAMMSFDTFDRQSTDGWGLGHFGYDIDTQLDVGVRYADFMRVKASRPSGLDLQGDDFCAAPGIPSTFSLTANDTFPAGTTFTLSNNGGLHQDLVSLASDGKLTISPLSVGPTTLNLQYTATTSSGATAQGAITIEVQKDKLCDLKPTFGDSNGQLVVGVKVPSLRFRTEASAVVRQYPIYQFRLANSSFDICTQPHWHASTAVYSLLDEVATSDPDPPGCGFGKYTKVERTEVFITQAEWEAFKAAHPPPS